MSQRRVSAVRSPGWLVHALVAGFAGFGVFTLACSGDGKPAPVVADQAGGSTSLEMTTVAGGGLAQPDNDIDSGAIADASITPREGSDSDASADGSTSVDEQCQFGTAGQPLELRCTGLYADFAARQLAPSVRSYDPAFHLWSDGAEKRRWVYLPGPIDTSSMDEWVFPVGTKFWKEFSLRGRRIETRMLWKVSNDRWYRTTYRWSADESSAVELTTGEGAANGDDFEIPRQSDCDTCHNGRRDTSLGFDAINLAAASRDTLNLTTLVSEGLLTTPPVEPVVVPGEPLDVQALGYLHTNCGVACHNRGGGAARFTQLYFRLETARLQNVQATDTWTTAMGRSTYFDVPNSTQSPSILSPCDPSSSAALYRMSHRDGLNSTPAGTQMPPLATHQVDPEGIATIANWLMSFAECS